MPQRVEVRPNHTRRKLLAGQHVFGVLLDILNPDLVEHIALLGFDYILIDGEHFPYDQGLYQHLVRAADLYGLTSTIRLESVERDWIARLIDLGIQGIHATHIGSRSDAESLVRCSKLFPVGSRGWGKFSRANRYEFGDEAEAVQAANEELLLIAQIEDRAGVEHIDEILQVEEIDVISIGPSDLAQSYGLPGQFQHPEVRQAIRRVCEATQLRGRALGADAAAAYAYGVSPQDYSQRNPAARHHIVRAGALFRRAAQDHLATWSNFREPQG